MITLSSSSILAIFSTTIIRSIWQSFSSFILVSCLLATSKSNLTVLISSLSRVFSACDSSQS